MAKKQNQFKIRRIFFITLISILTIGLTYSSQSFWQKSPQKTEISKDFLQAFEDLETLEVKGRAPKTGYSREQFGKGWTKDEFGCTTRNKILKRDLKNTKESNCKILSGILKDPYTGKEINFTKEKASEVQIDHIVALSDAWQKGAQNLSEKERVNIANDPQNLLAVDGKANQQKSDGDAATWLPSNKNFRCEYISRQIFVKKKYSLWVTLAEKDAMKDVLKGCGA